MKKIKYSKLKSIICLVAGLAIFLSCFFEKKSVRFLRSDASYRDNVKAYEKEFPKGVVPDDELYVMYSNGKDTTNLVSKLNENHYAYSYETIFQDEYTKKDMLVNIENAKANGMLKDFADEETLMNIYFLENISDTPAYKLVELFDYIEDNYSDIDLSGVKKYTDKVPFNREISAEGIADYLGIDKHIVESVLGITNPLTDRSYTMEEIVDFIKNTIFGTEFEKYLPEQLTSIIKQYGNYCSKEALNKKRSAKDISKIVDINKGIVSIVFGIAGEKKMSLTGFVDEVIYMYENDVTFLGQGVSKSQYELAVQAKQYMDMIVSEERFTINDLAEKFGFSPASVLESEAVQKFFGKAQDTVKMLNSPRMFLYMITKEMVDEETWEKIELIKTIYESLQEDQLQSYEEVLAVLEYIAKEKAKSIAVDYGTKMFYNSSWTMSLEDISELSIEGLQSEVLKKSIADAKKELVGNSKSILVIGDCKGKSFDLNVLCDTSLREETVVVGYDEYMRQRKFGLSERMLIAIGFILEAIVYAVINFFNREKKDGNLGVKRA